MTDNINRLKLVEVNSTDSIQEIVEKSIRNILICLGDDPDREGLKNTPNRVYRMYNEIFEGMDYTNDEIANMYNTCFEEVQTGDLVVVSDIPIFSMCEHHMMLLYNMKVHVGYLPNGKVIGLSKIARIADMVARRLQLQERIGMDISDILSKILDTDNIIVVIEGEHGCMTARGIKKPGTITRTASLRGAFKTELPLRREFYDLIHGSK